jgi:N-acetylglutamate synthase-like GNAT family acetyltransferase
MTNHDLSINYETQHFSTEVIQLCKRSKQRKPQHDDRVFWLSQEAEGIGIVRLRKLDSTSDDWLVRGLWIAPRFRRQGLAMRLMKNVLTGPEPTTNQRVYAMASHHLDDFYANLGFIPVEQETCPKPLKNQRKWRVWVYAN